MFDFIEVKFKDIVDIPRLNIGEGLTVMLGPSGGGKTTILRMLNKMISPTQGRILYNGQELKSIKSVEHRRRVMMLSQSPAMFDGTIRDNLTAALRFQEREAPGDGELYNTLAKLQLDKDLGTPVQQLSGGEKQRIAMGRLLLCDPEAYLLDEPSSALDEDTEDAIIKVVAEQVRTARKTVLMVTHSRLIADRYADQVIEIWDGKVRRNGHEHDN
jgi:putative ABC transport system ATP-binding protein